MPDLAHLASGGIEQEDFPRLHLHACQRCLESLIQDIIERKRAADGVPDHGEDFHLSGSTGLPLGLGL